ncbi:MAG: UDP-N-acetylmuramate--L-alanine ligase [bacterium]|nr:UDP-N-acetylmuramate--L-alanine ligase [bacterium]
MKQRKTAYLIGIKGVGMTALAQLLQARGFNVSGSDMPETFFTDAVLKRHGIKVYEGFNAGRIAGLVRGDRQSAAGDIMLIASSAYTDKNPEVAEAKKLKRKVHSYAEALSLLFNQRHGIAVCGSHGKTTISALLGYVFRSAGFKPTVVVGSEVPQFGGNNIAGDGRYFIAELDEYQNKLRHFKPDAALLTSIDYDHPDFFKTRRAYRNVFNEFIARLGRNGLLVACADDLEVRNAAKKSKAKIIWYGIAENGSLPPASPFWTGRAIRVIRGRWQFDAYRGDKKFGSFGLRLAGRHNVQNALGVIALAHAYGIKRAVLRKALAAFSGTRRRFEYIGTYRGAVLIDDYAHHPTEIRSTLAAARELFAGKRIVAVFHPHTYTRTKALLKEFARSFADADAVIVLDIYGSAREKIGGVSSGDLVKIAAKHHAAVRHIPTIAKTIAYLKKALHSDDVVIALGAGDVWKVVSTLAKFKHRGGVIR